MKAVSGWNYRPYFELFKPERRDNPYISRLAPFANGVSMAFIDNAGADAEHTVHLKRRGSGEERVFFAGKQLLFEADGLTEGGEYEVYVSRKDGARSVSRLFRCAAVPGRVINYLHPEDEAYAFSGRYLCSPSLVKLPGGRLLASMDVHAGGAPQNLTMIFSSDDNGDTWQYVTELFPCFWGKLFLCGGRLYMLATSNEYGDLLIGRSDDEGKTWTMPTVLFRGAANPRECGLHRAPMPVLRHKGRVMTDVQYGAWPRGIMADAVLSAPEDSDLTDARSWVISEFWKPSDAPQAIMENVAGGLEGSLIAGPDGRVYDFLRYASGKWLMLEYDPGHPEGKLKFAKIVDFPATPSKADVVFDEKSGYYLSIASYALESAQTGRNLLSLLYSKDLETWHLAAHLIDFRAADPLAVGFQYVSFLTDGEDILYQCRTAFAGAHNFHDSNYQTFHRIPGFRRLLKA